MSTVLRTGAFILRSDQPSTELMTWVAEVIHAAKHEGINAVRVEIHAYNDRIRDQIEADPFNTHD